MSTEGNKQIVTQFFDAFSRGDIDAAFAAMDDSATWWVPGTLPFSGIKTKAQYLQIVGTSRNGFPAGIRFEIKRLLAEGDYVAAEVESLGHHRNSKTYHNKYHFLIRLEDGKFVEVKEYMDTLHLHDLITPKA
ncbi:MAG: nuclear transport factor 2 family protein [Proteobacteria bacterium]|nr:nuclear transport factor 2 family protein [Pseudomonadota bacterium]